MVDISNKYVIDLEMAVIAAKLGLVLKPIKNDNLEISNNLEIVDITNEKFVNDNSISVGVIGCGKQGCAMSEIFYKLDVKSIAVDNSLANLKQINIPDSNKLFLDAIDDMQLLKLINDNIYSTQINILCLSLGVGFGIDACEKIIDLLNVLNKPIMVIGIVPIYDEINSESNLLSALEKLTDLINDKKISNLTIIDKDKIEPIYNNENGIDLTKILLSELYNKIAK